MPSGVSADSLNVPPGQRLSATQTIHSGIPEPQTKKRRGCLFWGCLTSLFLVLIGTAAIGSLGYQFLTGQVRQYTAEAAVELPKVEYSDADMEQLQQRLRRPSADVPPPMVVPNKRTRRETPSVETISSAEKPAPESDSSPGPGDLVLSARDINALVGRNPQLRGKVFVTIEGGQIAGEVSIPVPDVPGGEGRFFNASAIFHVEIHDDQLFVNVTDAYVKGQQAPKILLEVLTKENLACDLNKHPQLKPQLEKFESLSIVDDKVILRAKRDSTTNDARDGEKTTNQEPLPD